MTKPRIRSLGIAESPTGKLTRVWSCYGGGSFGRGKSPVAAYLSWYERAYRDGLVKTSLRMRWPLLGAARG